MLRLLVAPLLFVPAIPAIMHAVRATDRSRRGALVALVIVASLALLSVLSGMIKSCAGLAGLDPAIKDAELRRAMLESLSAVACVFAPMVALWAVPFAVGEVKRKRQRGCPTAPASWSGARTGTK